MLLAKKKNEKEYKIKIQNINDLKCDQLLVSMPADSNHIFSFLPFMSNTLTITFPKVSNSIKKLVFLQTIVLVHHGFAFM